ncbi:hypothetical protein C2G38_2048590 [Gigaspora rosea]|uniref:Serine-threonine/tyrosine-protein kinase catalytic domain-containing protein n=1 Tax=Gigaspora rosea TaxID=44941 RepID=A0A397TZT2_9GLOM|nr:hypothetical protein C2G38_2234717 [Gigaspora rosea]RIB04258.1 hypothetical protein C2G38_2048590 [Gigaspora rosea]
MCISCGLFAMIPKNLNADSPATSSNEMGGMLEYIDPQYILHGDKNYKRDKTSDIYSWNSSIFHLPFLTTYLSISPNKREKIIDDTPSDYAILYQKCWSSNPAMRPPLNLVLGKLETLSGLTVEFITNNIYKDKSNNVINSESESSDPGASLVYTCRQNPDKSQT